MKADPYPPANMLRAWTIRHHLPWLAFALGLPVLLVVLSLGAAYLDNAPLGLPLSLSGFINPIIVAYVLLVHLPMERLTQDALGAVRALSDLSEADYDRLLAETAARQRRGERLALVAGAATAVFLMWDAGLRTFSWLAACNVLSLAVVFALVAHALYGTVTDTRLIQRLVERAVFYSPFRPDTLQPVALWSLGGSLAFIVGIAISALVTPLPAILSTPTLLVVFVVIILTAVATFFFNLRGANTVMVRAKERELSEARRQLEATYRTLEVLPAQSDLPQVSALANKVTALIHYEQRMMTAPEWPYTPEILRRLALSILLPAASTAIRLLPAFLEGRQP